MTARLIDGKHLSSLLRQKISLFVEALRKKHHLIPGLAVVLVGDDPASSIYVSNKGKKATEVGIASFEYLLPQDASPRELFALLDTLNRAHDVHGILVQLPLPKAFDPLEVLKFISPNKDVDGFHPQNAGLLAQGYFSKKSEGFVPCTPLGCLKIAEKYLGNLRGLKAVVVGRSSIVGRPMAQLLLARDCTVTIAHSHTKHLEEVCSSADLLVTAVGRPGFINGSFVKKGACVIDVGINRLLPQEGGRATIVGDCDFHSCAEKADFITPVPGGVGPLTIAFLLYNTVKAACQIKEIPVPDDLLDF